VASLNNLFALSLEFFNNLIFVKFVKILTKYDLFCLMLILLFADREESGIGETRDALGDRLAAGLLMPPVFPRDLLLRIRHS